MALYRALHRVKEGSNGRNRGVELVGGRTVAPCGDDSASIFLIYFIVMVPVGPVSASATS